MSWKANTMPISLYKYLGIYGKSKGRGLESLFMAWLWQKNIRHKSGNRNDVCVCDESDKL